MELWPSQIRQIILDGHDVLRKRLETMEALVEKLQKAAPSAAAGSPDEKALIENLLEFRKTFLEHVAVEQNILQPALADADAWGAVRVEQMEKEHCEQRAMLDEFAAMAGGKKPADFLARVRRLITDMYADMKSEEEDFLNPDVLRDDVVAIDSSSE